MSASPSKPSNPPKLSSAAAAERAALPRGGERAAAAARRAAKAGHRSRAAATGHRTRADHGARVRPATRRLVGLPFALRLEARGPLLRDGVVELLLASGGRMSWAIELASSSDDLLQLTLP